MSYNVTPADQMSTLNPENVSSPFAISGGWNAGDPWLVLHVSSSAKGCSAWNNENWKQELFFQDNIWTKKMTFELVIFNFNHKLYILQLADLLLISIYDANLMFALIKHHPFLQMI